jgi:hypothetical protein
MLRRARKGLQVLLGLAIVFGFFAGWILAAGAAYELYMMSEVRSWPAKRAIITHSYAARSRGFGFRRHADVQIAGVYAGTAERFSLERIGFGVENAIVTAGRAQALAARYPVKAELEVFHEPGRPAHVILERENSTTPTWIALATGLALGLLPFALYGARRRRA